MLMVAIGCGTIASWSKLEADFSKGDKVILTLDNYSDTLFIGQTTPEEVLGKYGQTKVETFLTGFSGHTKKHLYGKRQIIEYKSKGLTFIFEGDGLEPKKIAMKNVCVLNEIIIDSPSNYCVDNICAEITKEDIIKKIGSGVYGMRDGMADSLNRVWYNSLGLTLSYKKTESKIVLIQIHRQETESYF